MQLGFAVPQAGPWATPDTQVEVARRAEQLGYASLWVLQRLLFPAEPTSPRWQPVYRSVHDPVVTLAFLAGQTQRIRLGTAVLNMPWFAPILLAKQAAGLDIVSRGRLDLGLGLGWAQEEYDATGAPMDHRGARAEEFVACLKELWTQDVAEFKGRYYQVERCHVEPKPVQRPSPPVLIGGSADPALRRAGRIADGWISSSGENLRAIGAALDKVRHGAQDAGRDPSRLRFVCRGVLRLRPGGTPDRRPLSGSLDEIRGDLALLAEQGVTEVFLDLNFDRHIGAPDADPVAAVDRAHHVLEAFAPGGDGGT